MAADWRTDRIGNALRGENPTVLRRLSAGFAVTGDVQFFDREPPDVAGSPVWLYPRYRWSDARFALAPRHAPLRRAITTELDHLRAEDRLRTGRSATWPAW